MNTGRVIEKEGFAALALRLRGQGINNLDLLTAVEQTPRTLFVPPQFAGDRPFLRERNMTLPQFLQLVRDKGDDDRAIIEEVKRCAAKK